MNPINSQKFVDTFSAFTDAPDNLLDDIISSSKTVTLPSDTLVYAEGDECKGIAFVFSGSIRVFKTAESGREITLYEIIPGETCILNVSCILSDSSYPANALTTEMTEALIIPSAYFLGMMSKYSEMNNFVYGLLSRRLTGVMELVEEVAFGRMDKRLMEYLTERGGNNELNTTHQTIANDLGSSREVISRLLKDLELKGKVSLSRNNIRLIH